MLVTEMGILRLYFGLDLFKGLTQVGKQIFNVLGSDGKTDGGLCDALFCQFLVVELGVCRTGRMDDQRFDIGYIGQQGEYLQVVDEAVRFRTSALDFKREDGAGSFGEIFLIKGWGSVLRKGRMVDLFHFRMVLQEVYYLQRILYVAFHSEREGFQSLQKEESIERTDGGSGIA